MDAEFPFQDSDQPELWSSARLDSEIRQRENLLTRIKAKVQELGEADKILRQELFILSQIAAERVMCPLKDYPIAKRGISDQELLDTLESCHGSRTKTAKLLGCTEQNVLQRLRNLRKKGIYIMKSPYQDKVKKGVA